MGVSLPGCSVSSFDKSIVNRVVDELVSRGRRYERPTSKLDKVQMVSERARLPNPNPKRWTVKRYWYRSIPAMSKKFKEGFLVVEVNYPDCTNYEGNKILVFRNTQLPDLYKQKLLDPHFTNNSEVKSPIARFIPTDEGWMMAKSFCIMMANLHGAT